METENQKQELARISRLLPVVFFREDARLSVDAAEKLIAPDGKNPYVNIVSRFSGGFIGEVWQNQMATVRELLPGWAINIQKPIKAEPVPAARRTPKASLADLTA